MPDSGTSSLHFLILISAISFLTLVACSSSATTPQSSTVPTSTLVPPTSTPPPVTPPPTHTPVPVIRAASLAESEPSDVSLLAGEDQQAIAGQVRADLLEQRARDGRLADVRLVLFEEAIWSSQRLLGCPNTSSAEKVEGYRIVFTGDAYIYEYHTDLQGHFRLCSERDISEAQDAVLVLVDPVADDLFRLAQQRLARERQIAPEDVTLESMTRVTWPDSSMGCSQSRQRVQPVTLDGYRLVVSVDGETVIYHTDFERIRECAAEDEVLPPELTEDATPEARSGR